MELSNAFSKIFSFLGDLFEVVILSSALFVFAYLFVAQPHQVTGPSMLPAFHDKEYLLTDKVSYRFKDPQRGDVIIFRYPVRPEIDYIKRIIALPGEEVMIKNGKVTIFNEDNPDGFELPEPYLNEEITTSPHTYILEGERVKVRDEEVLVMGDNRPHSSDSREWGGVPLDNIIGRAIFRYWPPDAATYLPRTTYYPKTNKLGLFFKQT